MHNQSLPPTDRDEVESTTETPVSSDAKVRPCNQAIRERLRKLRAENPRLWSNAQIGAKVKVNRAIISQYLSERGNIYPASVAKLEANAADMLQALERRRATGIETSPSEIADEMFAGWSYILKTNDLGAIVAESGDGKSRGNELIRAEHPLVNLIQLSEWCRSVHDVMREMWRVSAVDGWDRQTPQFPYLVQKMTGTNIPFLFDDAHKASRDALGLIASFQEKTKCPVALVGCPELVQKLERDPQLLSRVGIHYALAPRKGGDPKLLIHMVQSICKSIDGELDELIELCQQVEHHQGHKRAVEKQLKFAAELRQADDDLTWCQAFRNAHKHLLRNYTLS